MRALEVFLFFIFFCLRSNGFCFHTFLNKPEQRCNTEKRRRFHTHILRYSHGAEMLRMPNCYSNLNNIKTFTPLWLNKCPRLKLCLSFSLLWHGFLMKCSKFTWSACHHFFGSVFCRPSNGNEPRINIFHCLLLHLKISLYFFNCSLLWFKYQRQHC